MLGCLTCQSSHITIATPHVKIQTQMILYDTSCLEWSCNIRDLENSHEISGNLSLNGRGIITVRILKFFCCVYSEPSFAPLEVISIYDKIKNARGVVTIQFSDLRTYQIIEE